MRIVFIVKQLANGGAEREAVAFANELVKMGEEVHVVSIVDSKDDYIVDKRIHRHLLHGDRIRIPRLKGACNQLLMAALLRKIHGDVVLPFYVTFHLAVLLSRSRLIYTVRTNLEKELPKKSDYFRRKLACRFAKGIWIQTEGQRRFFSKKLQSKLFEVHNILDNRFLQIHKQPTNRIMHFISVGRLQPQKNQRLLIDAFGKMIRRTGNVVAALTIYGRPHSDFLWQEKELRAQVEELGLKDRVFLQDWVKDIEKRYEEADAFVLSSDYEGCPNALMEAMAAGLPCISTDCLTGPSMLIESGKDGLLVPVGDAETLSYAMQYLIEHPQEANRLGDAARQRMREWGTAREHAEQLRENLRRMCL